MINEKMCDPVEKESQKGHTAFVTRGRFAQHRSRVLALLVKASLKGGRGETLSSTDSCTPFSVRLRFRIVCKRRMRRKQISTNLPAM
jgi:hypothetical protein